MQPECKIGREGIGAGLHPLQLPYQVPKDQLTTVIKLHTVLEIVRGREENPVAGQAGHRLSPVQRRCIMCLTLQQQRRNQSETVNVIASNVIAAPAKNQKWQRPLVLLPLPRPQQTELQLIIAIVSVLTQPNGQKQRN